MSELIRRDDLIADAYAAADAGHAPESHLKKFRPCLHEMWMRHYSERMKSKFPANTSKSQKPEAVFAVEQDGVEQ